MIYRIVTQLRHGLDGSAQGKKNHLPMKNFISFNSLFYSRIERQHRRQVCFSRRLFLNRPRQVAQIQNCYFCDKDSLNTTNRSSFWAKSVAGVKISVKINRCLCAARNSGSNFRAPHSQSSVRCAKTFSFVILFTRATDISGKQGLLVIESLHRAQNKVRL